MISISGTRLRLFVLLGLFGVLVICVITSSYLASASDQSQYLEVHFLDVEQGDAILIETPDGVQMLVDGGPDTSVLRELGAVLGSFDKTIDVVLATHNDADHIGGLIDVLERYHVKAIFKTNNQHDTAVADQLNRGIDAEGALIIEPEAGQRYLLGASTTVTVLSPTGDVSNYESNTASLVVKVEYGDISFLLTGDAPIGIEEYLVRAYGPHLPSTVLKLGHHGSRTSSGINFLSTVLPTYSVVSAGAGNSYRHPHSEAVENVEAVGSKLLSTAQSGRVSFVSDGNEVWQKQ